MSLIFQAAEGHDYCIVQPLSPGKMKSGVAIDTYADHHMSLLLAVDPMIDLTTC